LNGDVEYGFYKFEDGKIHVLYLWTIYKSLCKKQLKELNDLLFKNGWERHVKFLSIYTDSNKDYAMKMTKILNIHKMDNLYIDSLKKPNHPIFDVIENSASQYLSLLIMIAILISSAHCLKLI
jgi:hypothetical protein